MIPEGSSFSWQGKARRYTETIDLRARIHAAVYRWRPAALRLPVVEKSFIP